jgi:uncharacterized protein YkwD
MARAVLVVVLVLAAGGVASAGVADKPLPGRPSISKGRTAATTVHVSALARLEQQVFRDVNRQRIQHGLVPLRVNGHLGLAARSHSLAMAEHGFFAHEAYDGSAFWLRIKAAYPALAGRTWSVGENLAWASPELTAEHAVEMWLASPQHRQNMLAPRWRDVGIGIVRALGAPGVYDGLDVTIVTADFGVR